MIPVQMLLELVVSVECPFNVLDSTDEAQNLVLHHKNHDTLQLVCQKRNKKRTRNQN